MHTSYLYPLRLRGGYICYIIKPVPTYVVKTKHAWGQAFFMGFLLFLSDFMVPLIIFYIVGFAILGKRPVFDDFLYGAKEGMQTVVQVLPSLVGLMTAVGVLRASGFLEFLTHILEVPATSIGLPGPIIPIAFIRLVSNSAAVGLVLDLFKNYGPDSQVGLMASMTETKELGLAGQSDGIFLIAQDTARHTLKILMIPRDTMTEIPITNKERTLHDTKITQLTMAYAYGDGREGSCENMVESVQKLLCGFTIDQYMAVDTTVVAQLNDAVGGVTVTIPTDGMEKKDPAFVKGNQVTLHGNQAEAFVRYRDTNRDFSALYRMDQQQEYITQYFQAVKAASKTDSQIVAHLFDMIQDYMVTDMTKDQYIKIAMDGMEAGSLTSEDFYTVPGTGETTEKYDVYRADRRAAIDIILNLFYRETE